MASKNEQKIQYKIWAKHNFKNVLPNIHTEAWGGSEVDALYITDNGYAYFYEIKCSHSDFKADFKKKRHKLLLERSQNMRIKPKYFIYVCFGFEPKKEEIPEYAGCLLVSDYYNFKTLKSPPVIYNQKLTEDNLIFINKKIYARYLKMKYKNAYNLLLEERKSRR